MFWNTINKPQAFWLQDVQFFCTVIQSQQITYKVVPTIKPWPQARDIIIDSQVIKLHAWLLDNVLFDLAHIVICKVELRILEAACDVGRECIWGRYFLGKLLRLYILSHESHPPWIHGKSGKNTPIIGAKFEVNPPIMGNIWVIFRKNAQWFWWTANFVVQLKHTIIIEPSLTQSCLTICLPILSLSQLLTILNIKHREKTPEM